MIRCAPGTEATVAAGADGCRGGWIVALRLESGPIEMRVVPSFRSLLDCIPEGPLAIDIPIGLPSRGVRAGDRLARKRLGPRRASIFPAPSRALLGAGSYREACALHREAEGKAVSVQAWNIFAKVAEVDSLMTPGLQARVVEAHPEICFTMMNDGTPPTNSKKTDAGRRERLRLLERRLSGAAEVISAPRPRGAAADDLLDALAVLWTAERYRHGVAEALTEPGALDERSLRMEIWF